MGRYRQLRLRFDEAPTQGQAVKPQGPAGRPSRPAAPSDRPSHGMQDTTLMEQVVARANLMKALKHMERKEESAPGIDGMTVPELRPFLQANWPTIKGKLLQGTYEPQPVKRVEIPKPGGGKRPLGIPTVLDRFIQQALLQVLTPIFEPTFSEHSYGFRPGRSQRQAVEQAQAYIQEGNRWVVDMDLSSFFDRVNHDMLMARVARCITDKRVLKLLRGYLEAGVMIDGVKAETTEGTPQGGPISPLLSNIMLDDLDWELERRGHSFVRYADDFQIYVGSPRAGERVMRSLRSFLEEELQLKVNREKSAVGTAWERAFLGFGFYVAPGGEVRLRLAPKTWQRVRERIRDITDRSNSRSMSWRIDRLTQYLEGWLGYFHIADAKTRLQRLGEWMRRRLRMCIWNQWKRMRTRVRKLRGFGLDEDDVWNLSKSRKGPWVLARTHQLHQALNARYWNDQGLIDLLAVYRTYR